MERMTDSTPPTPESVLTEALCDPDDPQPDGHEEWWSTPNRMAANILDASPTLASAIALGLAWQRASAALPEGYHLMLREKGTGDRETHVDAFHFDGRRKTYRTEGPTPEAALIALAEALEARRGEA